MTQENNNFKQHQSGLLVILEEFDRICKALQIPYVLFAGTLLGAVRHEGFIPWDDDLDVLMLRSDYQRFLQEAEQLLDQERFFLQKEFSPHWPMFFSKLRLNNTTCLEKYHPRDPQIHQGVYIDIFPCDNAAATSLGRRLQFLASKVVIAKALDKRGYDTPSKGKRIFMALCRCLPGAPFLRIVKTGSPNGKYVHGFPGGAHGYRKSVFERNWLSEAVPGVFEGKQFPIPVGYDALLKDMYGDYMRLPPESERMVKQHALVVDLEHSWETYSHYRDDMDFEIHTRSIR